MKYIKKIFPIALSLLFLHITSCSLNKKDNAYVLAKNSQILVVDKPLTDKRLSKSYILPNSTVAKTRPKIVPPSNNR